MSTSPQTDRPAPVRLPNGTWRITCAVCGTAFVSLTRRAVFCSEDCRSLADSRDPIRHKIAYPLLQAVNLKAQLRRHLRFMAEHPDDVAAGRVTLSGLFGHHGLSVSVLRKIYGTRIRVKCRKCAVSHKRALERSGRLMVRLRRRKAWRGSALTG